MEDNPTCLTCKNRIDCQILEKAEFWIESQSFCSNWFDLYNTIEDFLSNNEETLESLQETIEDLEREISDKDDELSSLEEKLEALKLLYES